MQKPVLVELAVGGGWRTRKRCCCSGARESSMDRSRHTALRTLGPALCIERPLSLSCQVLWKKRKQGVLDGDTDAVSGARRGRAQYTAEEEDLAVVFSKWRRRAAVRLALARGLRRWRRAGATLARRGKPGAVDGFFLQSRTTRRSLCRTA